MPKFPALAGDKAPVMSPEPVVGGRRTNLARSHGWLGVGRLRRERRLMDVVKSGFIGVAGRFPILPADFRSEEA
jgi:hypothetical protein